jgi:hypothetical protein
MPEHQNPELGDAQSIFFTMIPEDVLINWVRKN